MKNILITGGAGFIGSNLTKKLVDKGFNVTILDNLSKQIHSDGQNLYLSVKDIATFIKGDVRNKSDWKKALKNQPSMGRALLLIASLYASSANDCGDNQFNKRAIYWLAADTARKAGRVDASIRKSANKTALSYMGRAPSKTDIFSQANEGTKITFNCWVGGSVTVPKL